METLGNVLINLDLVSLCNATVVCRRLRMSATSDTRMAGRLRTAREVESSSYHDIRSAVCGDSLAAARLSAFYVATTNSGALLRLYHAMTRETRSPVPLAEGLPESFRNIVGIKALAMEDIALYYLCHPGGTIFKALKPTSFNAQWACSGNDHTFATRCAKTFSIDPTVWFMVTRALNAGHEKLATDIMSCPRVVSDLRRERLSDEALVNCAGALAHSVFVRRDWREEPLKEHGEARSLLKWFFTCQWRPNKEEPVPTELMKTVVAAAAHNHLVLSCMLGFATDRILRIPRDWWKSRLVLSQCMDDPVISFTLLRERIVSWHDVQPLLAAPYGAAGVLESNPRHTSFTPHFVKQSAWYRVDPPGRRTRADHDARLRELVAFIIGSGSRCCTVDQLCIYAATRRWYGVLECLARDGLDVPRAVRLMAEADLPAPCIGAATLCLYGRNIEPSTDRAEQVPYSSRKKRRAGTS